MEIKQLAQDLFYAYGNSVNLQKSHMSFRSPYFDQQSSSSSELSTFKMKAIFAYLGRVLKPIWETRFTYLPDYKDVKRQMINIDREHKLTILPQLDFL